MQNYADSDYARNKNSAGIVYRFSDGTAKELTFEDFLLDNPAMTEDEFLKWKRLSDDDYYEQDRAENNQTSKNVSLNEDLEIFESVVPSPDEVVIEAPYRAVLEKERRKLAKNAWAKLTCIQRKRFSMYHAEGLTEQQIAKREGVAHQTVSRSLISAAKNLEKFLKFS